MCARETPRPITAETASAGISSEVILIVQSIIIFFMAAEGGIRTALQDRSAIRKARREAAAKEAGV